MTIRCEKCRKVLDVCIWDVPPQGLICDECCEKIDKEKAEKTADTFTLFCPGCKKTVEMQHVDGPDDGCC